VTPSIGIALCPDDGSDFDSLSRCADAAMYRAKQDGRNNYRFFTAEMQARSERTLTLENALRRALERNQLRLHYQPQVSLASGCVIGAEALLRWNHPELGRVPPAETCGLILPIGEWVLRTAVQQLKAWLDGGMAPITLSVNLSSVQFRHADLPELVTSILNEAQLPAHLLELELTEGVAMTDPLGAVAVMNNLHERGVRMSIDDFGTGYSSLSYLKKFRVYKVKIDQSFVHDITEDSDDKAIVSAIISMATSLGMQTIAEGVETEGQLEFLKAEGCTEVQGYYFSRPLPVEQFEAFMRTRSSSNLTFIPAESAVDIRL
jgi:EAL domain-containing protein (putative c-di-GMP-specific phosphodiesterase class I)